MLAGPQQVAGITIHPFSLDILWVLEEAECPLFKGDNTGGNLTALQCAQVIFAFAAPEQALEAASIRAEDGAKLTPFDREALAYVRAHLPVSEIPAVTEQLGAMLRAAMAAAPGGGANPPKPEA